MKSGRRPADKPLINRGSTAGFLPPTVYIGIPLFVLPKRCSGQLSSMPWGARGTVVSCANKPVGVPSCRARPAQPPRRAPPDPTRPWCVRVLDSTSCPQPGARRGRRLADKPLINRGSNACFVLGLHRKSFVRACGASFRTVVFYALGGKRVTCVLGKPTRWRPVLPAPALPRPALRRPESFRPWYVRVLDATSSRKCLA